MPIPNLPESFYRVQFHAGFTFRDATAILPYLASLGVTHLYASPYLKACPGSTHGYDVIDHCSLNPELGTTKDFDDLMAALADHGMSHILDIVPNHVGVATNENQWWNEVLANGRDSTFGGYFDIAWDGSPRPELHGKVLLPLLGDPYGQVLERGELRLVHEQGRYWVAYHDRRFPISPESVTLQKGETPTDLVERLNGTAGQPRSFDALHDLLEAQHYRLAYWKNAADEINYRRFFDVNDLAALAMERQDVFDATHRFIFQLIGEGKVTGLRLDHPDGLYDPATYFDRLQDRYRAKTGAKGDRPLYLLAEKILAPDEPLPSTWKIHGTTGYDFLNVTNGLFVELANAEPFTETYRDWLSQSPCPPQHDFEQLVYEKKKLILDIALASELHMLAHRLDRLAQRYRGWRDYSLAALMRGLREVIACFGVYRTYISSADVTPTDREVVEAAIGHAVRRNPTMDAGLFDFIRDVLLQRYPDTFGEEDREAQLSFTGKFQQLTSPTTAKGIEDTAFYLYNRFISLNEVGGEPSRFGYAPQDVHDWFRSRQRDWPRAMSSLATHDTKRSDDVRARLNVLSELPDEWRAATARWRDLNARHKTDVAGAPAPDANDEYLVYQTLLGVWPLEPWSADEYDALSKRVEAYLLKALREAKLHTRWTQQNAAYEEATTAFARRLLDRTTGGAFLDDFAALRKRVSRLGLINSLSQTLVRLTAPGVPDTYQGSELWDFSLVDPDNRRPVDYARRQELLSDLNDSQPSADRARRLLETIETGQAKLLLHQAALRLRRSHPGLLAEGDYVPLQASGSKADHVFAFLRQSTGKSVLVVVPRLPAGLIDEREGWPVGPSVWGDTHLQLPGPDLSFRDLLTGQELPAEQTRLPVGRLLEHFPVLLAVG